MPKRTSAGLENGDLQSSLDKKRKLQSRPVTQSNEARETSKQQTISDLFTASQQKTSLSGINTTARSPTSKCARVDIDSSPPRAMNGPQAATRTSSDMYKFSSRHSPNGAQSVIDLTGSSPANSPRKQSISRPLRPVNPALGPKKLVVKNLRPIARTDPSEYLNLIWDKLNAALTIVFAQQDAKQGFSFSMEELYKGVENVCKQSSKGAEELYSRLREKSKAYVVSGLKVPLLDRLHETSADMLRATITAWKRWNEQLITVQNIFYYLDRAYLLQSGRASLREMATGLFRSAVFDDTQLQGRIVEGACNLVEADRKGQSPFLSTFKDAVSMFHELQTYTSAFEPRLLENSQEFIVRWAEQESQQNLASYAEASHRLIKSELERCELFGLDNSTRRDLLALLETHLIDKRATKLANEEEIGELLTNNNEKSLGEIYSLLERRQLGTSLRHPFEIWIDTTGTKIVFDEDDYDNMVVKLLSLKTQLDHTWRVAFRRNSELGHGLRESFEKFINRTKKSEGTHNTDNSKPGEMIAKYVDMLLRGGYRAIPRDLISVKAGTAEDEDDNDVGLDEDSKVNNQLDQVLDLFRFIHGKAVFEAFYKKDLARRLLMNRSASADAERSMLTRLKTECGAGFTQNLEQMFRDIELAKEEQKSYNDLLNDRNEKPAVDLNVNVLSASAWPTYPDVPVNIPVSIQSSLDKFEQHYKSKHSGRKLTWKHGLAHCQIKAKFSKGVKEIVVSSFQAVVLLMFNGVADDQHISYEQLKAETGLCKLKPFSALLPQF